MEKTSLAAQDTPGTDIEVQAIRSLIEREQDAPAARAQTVRSQPRLSGKGAQARIAQAPEAVAPAPAAQRPPNRTRRAQGESMLVRQARLLAAKAWAAVRSYHPDRRSVLRTSLILLLMLKPFMIIGWTLFAVFATVLLLLFVGSDAFWRKVILVYQAYARRKPEAARVLKLRAYVIARRWDSLLQWVPQGLADMLRSPDLREIIAADARHDQAMNKRLSRLREDVAA